MTVSWGVAETTVMEDADEPTPAYGCEPVTSMIVSDRSTTLAAGETATVMMKAPPVGFVS